ncbi:MAG TPA: DUF5668 domain-containing protein [Bacteroidia bacterium]
MNTEMKDRQFDCRKDWEDSRRRGKVLGGIFVVAAGVLFLLRRAGVEFPHWLLDWPMLLIAAGIVSLFKHGFKRFFGFVPIAIGVFFILSREFNMPHISQFIWPVVIILIGLAIIFKPRGRRHHKGWHHHRNNHEWSNKDWTNVGDDADEFVRSSTTFGAIKKNIVSKDFKGGEVKAVFGGVELNFIQADIKDKAVLELTAVFGGIKLVVPANWEIQSELHTFCGGIEDNRPVDNGLNADAKKVLLLKGNATFGGIEIHNY